MSRPTSSLSAALCPACGRKGRPVSSVTLLSLLSPERAVGVEGHDWVFCAEPQCHVVYYSPSAEERYAKNDLRVKVHQKEPLDGSVPVCCCFNHTPDSIAAEMAASGHSAVIASITAEVQAGRCSCEVRNPQGTCCLGNVSRVVRRVEEGRRRLSQPDGGPGAHMPGRP